MMNVKKQCKEVQNVTYHDLVSSENKKWSKRRAIKKRRYELLETLELAVALENQNDQLTQLLKITEPEFSFASIPDDEFVRFTMEINQFVCDLNRNKLPRLERRRWQQLMVEMHDIAADRSKRKNCN